MQRGYVWGHLLSDLKQMTMLATSPGKGFYYLVISTVLDAKNFREWSQDMFYRTGDAVEILPEFRDSGDEDFDWIVVSDEEKGRVDVTPTNHSMAVKPMYTLQTDQIRLKTQQAVR